MDEFYLGILGLGVVFTFIGIIKWIEFGKILANGIKVQGKVADVIERQTGGDAGYTYYPVLEFTTSEDAVITKKSDIGLSGNKYKKGQKVEILYQEDDPYNCEINNTFRLVVFPRLFTAIGLTLLISDALVYFEIIKL